MTEKPLTRDLLEDWALDLSHVALRKAALHYLNRLAETERERDTALGVNKVRKRFDRDLISENERLARSHEQLRKIVWAYREEFGHIIDTRGIHQEQGCPGCMLDAALSAGEETP